MQQIREQVTHYVLGTAFFNETASRAELPFCSLRSSRATVQVRSREAQNCVQVQCDDITSVIVRSDESMVCHVNNAALKRPGAPHVAPGIMGTKPAVTLSLLGFS